MMIKKKFESDSDSNDETVKYFNNNNNKPNSVSVC